MRVSYFASMVVNLFLIVDPVGCLPLFAAITRNHTTQRRRQMVVRAVVVAFAVLAVFAMIGRYVLGYFQVGIPAVKIAGGVLLFGIGLEMLYGRISRTETTEREEEEAAGKDDPSITPLAIPLLAGPGGIAAVVLFSGQIQGPAGGLSVVVALAFVMLAAWTLLRFTGTILSILGEIGIKVIARVMGLMLLFVSTQFVIDGLVAAGIAGRAV